MSHEEVETRNAIIKMATITNDEHGLMTAWLHLDYGGADQSFGGFALYLPKSFTHSANQPNFAGHFIWRVMEIAEVAEWSHLKGKSIRVRCQHTKVHAIGHIIKDDWFDPVTDFLAMKDNTNAP